MKFLLLIPSLLLSIWYIHKVPGSVLELTRINTALLPVAFTSLIWTFLFKYTQLQLPESLCVTLSRVNITSGELVSGCMLIACPSLQRYIFESLSREILNLVIRHFITKLSPSLASVFVTKILVGLKIGEFCPATIDNTNKQTTNKDQSVGYNLLLLVQLKINCSN